MRHAVMALASYARPPHLSFRLWQRSLRKLTEELQRLESASGGVRSSASASRLWRERPGGDGVLCAARRREEALRIANGDCRAEIFKQLMRGARTKGD